jgi:hypothetical protein
MAYYDGFIVMLMLSVAVLEVARRPVLNGAAASVPRWRAIADQLPAPVAS